ncbi:MAG: DUF924 domain-containing protein [Deltaproteobacteria bacterium]|nr:DUF924 domain-containing protein [Deltaproteobacteria bacterium]
MTTTPDDVLTFWFPPGLDEPRTFAAQFPRWFGGGPDLDREIEARFGDAVRAARAGELDAWAATPRGRLALVVLLDQFSRNLYRGRAEAFAADARCRALVAEGLARGDEHTYGTAERLFFWMAYGHSEDLALQSQAVGAIEQLALEASEALRPVLLFVVRIARSHLVAIARFGRNPQRNEALGRPTTAEERAYLAIQSHLPGPQDDLRRLMQSL